jgi:hypothetical protein
MGGTIVLGIWLAFSVGGYDIWDGWIIAALVLWVASAPLGQRTGAMYTQGTNKARASCGRERRAGAECGAVALNRSPGLSCTLWSSSFDPHRHDLKRHEHARRRPP